MKKPVTGFTDSSKQSHVPGSGQKPALFKSLPITSGKNGRNGQSDPGVKDGKVQVKS